MTTYGLTASRARRMAVVSAGALGVSLMAAVGPTSVSVVAFAASPSSATGAGVLAASASASVVSTSAASSAGTAVSAPVRRSVVPATTSTVRPVNIAPFRFATRAYNHWWARKIMANKYHWTSSAQFVALRKLWDRESHWNMHAHNSRSGAHGIPQALPGSKMRTAGRDWRTNPVTQIRWGLTYIHHRYGTPVRAWSHFLRHGWY